MKNLKKSVILTLVFAFIGLSINAQSGSGFGIKGGINYGANGSYFESAEANAQNPDRNIGYNIGVFGKIGDKFYLKPELVYTATKSDYSSDEFTMKTIDMPILIGLKVLGPVSVFAGPSLQYIIDANFEGVTIDTVEEDFTVGLNFGVGVNFNSIGIDLRYERGFNSNEATIIDNNLGPNIVSRIDTRPEQLILSLSIGF